MRIGITLALAASVAAFGQSQTHFDLADVHPSTRSDLQEMTGGLMRGHRYLLRHATMLELIRLAYDVDPKKVLGGPNWVELDRFEVRAIVPAGTTSASVKPMLRTLLAERFGLAAHRDTKPVPAWALTAGQHPLLKPSSGSGESGCHFKESDDFVSMACHNTTTADFVSTLRGGNGGIWYYLTGNLVVDRTELSGTWDFDLKYSARWNTSVGGTRIVSLFDAIDKLGLNLEPSMVPMPVVVVDRVNRTPTPNSAGTANAFPPAPTEFLVAAVKPADPTYRGADDFQLKPSGLVDLRAMTLKWLAAAAWGVTEEMIANAPRFMDSDRWDIAAKAPEEVIAADGDHDYDALSAMVKTLLMDRFQMAAHFEDRPMAAPVLTAGKPKLKKASPDSRSGCAEGPATLMKVDPRTTNPTAARLVTCTNVSMAYLASHLRFFASGYVHSDVLDATGLEGGWDFTLSFSKVSQLQTKKPGIGEASDPNGSLSVQEALERQLGLKLVTRTRPVHVLVIDRVERRPSEN
jgi:uncharacterized protein (TIGR03435 family)